MRYQKPCNTKYGFILTDIILGLSLITVITVLIVQTSYGARLMFDQAKIRTALMDVFEKHEGEFASWPPGSCVEKTYLNEGVSKAVISAKVKRFGNELVETDITTSFGSTTVDFVKVRRDVVYNKYSYSSPFCSVDIFGKSGSPVYPKIKQIKLPIPSYIVPTDIIVRNNIVYVSLDSSIQSDPDLVIVDITDRDAPKLVSQINTGPGLSSIALSQKYIFAAALSSAAQVHVIKLNNLSSPVVVKKYKLPAPNASSTLPFATSINYRSGRIYLGTEKWDGDELSIIDVSSPESPFKISGIKTNSKITNISLDRDTLYVSASDQNQIRYIDVSDDYAPRIFSLFSESGWQRMDGRALGTFEGNILFGQTSGGYNIVSDHELFYLNEATSSVDIPGGVYGAIADRQHIYAATRSLNKELSIYETSLSSSTATYISIPTMPQTLTCDNDKIYLLSRSSPEIYEITR